LAGGHHIRYPHNNGWIAIYWYAGEDIIRPPTYPFIYILKKQKNKKKLPCMSLTFFLVTFANHQSLLVFVLGLSLSFSLFEIKKKKKKKSKASWNEIKILNIAFLLTDAYVLN
jgi:hypothetical protein